ncbi:glycerophosphodiester phosphodiesterase [Paractinoplanes rhizophilus]|uniref:Glycerophosphodiester phosphodiesterase n=1 Tax=Paractinoplanes rhizophilus TaxID=1416877 RepID=A0ABW2I5L4_9ACTN
MLAVAHRAGNSLTGLRAALAAGVDLVEADVWLRRDALEVRHGRARRGAAAPLLHEILAAAGDEPRLLLDLKGRSAGLAARVAEAVRDGPPVAVCTKQWAMLDAFAGDPNVRRILSAANRLQLARLRARLRRAPADGVSVRLRLLTAPVVAELRRATDVVLAWPVDTAADLARAERLGVTGVVGKDLSLLSRLA